MTHRYDAQDIIDTIIDEASEGLTNEQILAVLEDGQALAELGFTDDDQEAIEEAYDIVKNRLVNKVFILDDANEVIEMTEAEFIAEYATEVSTPFGIQKEHFWNPETGKMMFWQAGREKENFEYPLEYSKKEADAILFKFAKMDADRYGVSYFNDREEAEEIAAELKEEL
jgi:hypothetical protein